jgi:hypothetical protein
MIFTRLILGKFKIISIYYMINTYNKYIIINPLLINRINKFKNLNLYIPDSLDL